MLRLVNTFPNRRPFGKIPVAPWVRTSLQRGTTMSRDTPVMLPILGFLPFHLRMPRISFLPMITSRLMSEVSTDFTD